MNIACELFLNKFRVIEVIVITMPYFCKNIIRDVFFLKLHVVTVTIDMINSF